MNCPSCGARILDGASFCERCGLQVGIAPYKSSQLRPQPTKDNKVLWIVAIVVIVVVVVPIILSAMLYFMVLGFGGESPPLTPASSLIKSTVTGGVKFTFAPITKDTQWGDVRILMADADHTASWSPMTANLVNAPTAEWIGGSQMLGTLNVFVNITDIAGNGYINAGDYFTLTVGDGTFSSVMTYTVTIVYDPTGADICHAVFQG